MLTERTSKNISMAPKLNFGFSCTDSMEENSDFFSNLKIEFKMPLLVWIISFGLFYWRPMKDQCTTSANVFDRASIGFMCWESFNLKKINGYTANICSSLKNKAILYFMLFGLWSQSVYSYSKCWIKPMHDFKFSLNGVYESSMKMSIEQAKALYTSAKRDALNEMKRAHKCEENMLHIDRM